jgi:AcrR family transcriptional regulator
MQRTSRKRQVLEASYGYVLREGIVGLSLRPLAAEVGSSASVLLYLFGSKDELVRALLVRAGREERLLLVGLPEEASLGEQATALWRWLSVPAHRPLLRLWVQVYAASLVEPDGPWHGFAQDAVQGWLDVLAAAQSPQRRRSKAGIAERTLTLAVLRGAVLDLLASGDEARTTAAVRAHLAQLP